MTPAERLLAAEVRAVEEGHHAIHDPAGECFTVVSDTRPGVTYRITVGRYAGSDALVARCDGPAGQRNGDRRQSGCKHGLLVFRRGERRGWARNVDGRWVTAGPLAEAAA